MSDCLHCDIHELLDSELEGKEANLAEIAAKVTEVLADIILMAPPDDQSTLMADILANLGSFLLEKKEDADPTKPRRSSHWWLQDNIIVHSMGELSMRALSLAEALKIIEGTFAAAREHNCHALAAIVLDAGGRIKAFQKQDGASLMRFEIAYGKAFAALSLGR